LATGAVLGPEELELLEDDDLLELDHEIWDVLAGNDDEVRELLEEDGKKLLDDDGNEPLEPGMQYEDGNEPLEQAVLDEDWNGTLPPGMLVVDDARLELETALEHTAPEITGRCAGAVATPLLP
jgi:hypothetical protein